MNIYLRVFGAVFVIAAVYGVGSSLVSGSVHVKGMREPIRRQERPRDYWLVMGVATFIFGVLVWALLTS